MNIIDIARQRYTTKVFDAQARLSDAQVAQIEELLRLTPSSTNVQPWHFIMAATAEGKAQVAQGMAGAYAANAAKVMDASHVVVLCSRIQVSDDYLWDLVEQEAADGRIANEQGKHENNQRRAFFVNLHRYERRDVQHWIDKQVYIALGNLLLGAAALDIDACPIEGFDPVLLDEALQLRQQGLTSTLVVALGKRHADDFNAQMPKSRWPVEQVMTRI